MPYWWLFYSECRTLPHGSLEGKGAAVSALSLNGPSQTHQRLQSQPEPCYMQICLQSCLRSCLPDGPWSCAIGRWTPSFSLATLDPVSWMDRNSPLYGPVSICSGLLVRILNLMHHLPGLGLLMASVTVIHLCPPCSDRTQPFISEGTA